MRWLRLSAPSAPPAVCRCLHSLTTRRTLTTLRIDPGCLALVHAHTLARRSSVGIARRRTAPNRTPPALIRTKRLRPVCQRVKRSSVFNFEQRSCRLRRRSRFRHTLLPCMLFPQVQAARAARAWRRPKLHVSQRVERAVRAPRRVRGSVMTPWTPLDRLGRSFGRRPQSLPFSFPATHTHTSPALGQLVDRFHVKEPLRGMAGGSLLSP